MERSMKVWVVQGYDRVFRYPCQFKWYAMKHGYSLFDVHKYKTNDVIDYWQRTKYGVIRLEAYLVTME